MRIFLRLLACVAAAATQPVASTDWSVRLTHPGVGGTSVEFLPRADDGVEVFAYLAFHSHIRSSTSASGTLGPVTLQLAPLDISGAYEYRLDAVPYAAGEHLVLTIATAGDQTQGAAIARVRADAVRRRAAERAQRSRRHRNRRRDLRRCIRGAVVQ